MASLPRGSTVDLQKMDIINSAKQRQETSQDQNRSKSPDRGSPSVKQTIKWTDEFASSRFMSSNTRRLTETIKPRQMAHASSASDLKTEIENPVAVSNKNVIQRLSQ